MSVSLGVLILVFLGIALRQLFRLPLRIWQIVGIGAAIILFTEQISLHQALHAIDWNVIFFLFGMFYICSSLEQSGLIHDFVSRILLKDCSKKALAFFIVFGMGIFSALFMNDTLAILGTPLLLKVAHHRRLQTTPLLLGLAFAITIGSVCSPIGNPQNLLIALQAPINAPFATFLKYLALPTLINLILLYFLLLKWMNKPAHYYHEIEESAPYHKRLMTLSKLALLILVLMIGYNLIASYLPIHSIPLPGLTLIPAAFLLILGPKRKEIFSRLDWATLIFFIGLFILMKSVWINSSLKTVLLTHSPWMESIPGVMTLTVLLSQLISNVPLVALYLSTLTQQPPAIYMALAAGSTIAGNVLIFGAASNFIIAQNAEKRGDLSFTFFTFAKYGVPLSLLNFAIYWLFLTYL